MIKTLEQASDNEMRITARCGWELLCADGELAPASYAGHPQSIICPRRNDAWKELI